MTVVKDRREEGVLHRVKGVTGGYVVGQGPFSCSTEEGGPEGTTKDESVFPFRSETSGRSIEDEEVSLHVL